ncbi:MAG: SUMF1/EgtB/PvdO family nonheme iron enzyme [Leptolyngbya sp. SIO1E4]|nr:SUMF1/EgtB/PvdO family nonheme iron enzyme [Leptolyngbya sp. SIO1E4]
MGQGKKVALLVGVGEYGSGLKSLQCPANGVTELQAVLEEASIGGFDEVIPLVNPDVGTMRTRMGEVFSRLRKRDLVVFYFTGHGIKTMTGEFYLTTSQTQLFENGQLNPGTAVEASFVKGVISNCYAQRKVIILDCCFGAAFAEGFLTMDSGGVDVEAQLGGEGWVVLTAATARNYALEQAGEPLSVYTRYLVEGLKTGAAAQEGQDYISVGHLYDYVRHKVQTAAPTMEPAIFNGYQGEEILLARTVINPESTYRQKVQTKIRRGRIAPAGKRFLETWRQKLGLAPERAAEIETEVLQPYVEKQRHLDWYAETLREEIAEEFPFSPEAIKDLKDLQRLWNLRDEDVKPVMQEVLREQGSEHEARLAAMLIPPENVENIGQASPTTPKANVAWALPTLQTYPPFVTVRVDERGQVTERLTQQAQYFVEDLGKGVTLEMVRVPGGEFLMGAPEGEKDANNDEKPQHRVQLPEFFMGKFPITQAQYQAVIGQNPSQFKGGQRPVERVSWEDAVAFCKALSARVGRTYRLPSEAEWEYACRTGTETPFYFGPTIRADLANYDGNYTYSQGPKGTYRHQTTDVGQFPPNAFGLYDLHGNVYEWCQDVWHSTYNGAPIDGSAWLEGGNQGKRVRRGGSWPYSPRACRSAFRFSDNAVDRINTIGFRVVCAAPRTL